MPMCFVEAPQGLPPDVKRKLHEELYDAIFEAHHIPDIRTFIREYSPENVGQDSRICLAERARRAGVEVKLDIFPEQQHTFQMCTGRAPEANQAISKMQTGRKLGHAELDRSAE